MKKLNRLFLPVFAVIVALSYLILPVLQVNAATSSSLSIAPRKDYVIEPGKSVDDTLIIRNADTKAALNLTLRVVDFSFTDNGGTPKLMMDPNAPQTTWSLKPFINITDGETIEPGSSKTIDLNIKIPAGHGAGSYYSAIVYSSASGEGGNVGLSASGVTLVFVNIPGDVHEDLQLKKLGPYDRSFQGDLKGYKFPVTQKPEVIGYTLKNDGNVVENPVGSITLTDIFGRKQVINEINPNRSLALIGQERTFTSCIKLKPESVKIDGVSSKSVVCDTPSLWPGHYKINLELYYGQNGNQTQEILKTGGFWYLPWWFIFISIIVLGVVAFYVIKLKNAMQTKFYGPKVKKSSGRRRK